MPLWFYIPIGWVLGSFCGAYVYRWPREMSMLKPIFSHCPKCKKNIPFYHNIPVLSYIILGGKSACCKQPIAIDYLLIELSSLLFYPIFIYPFHDASVWIQLQWTIFFYFLLVQAFIDIRHRLIPDQITLLGTILGLSFSFAYAPHAIDFLIGRSLGALAGFGSLWTIAKVYSWKTGREGLGMGDMKLLLMIGSFLSITGIFLVIFLSSVIGLLVGVFVMVFQKGNLKTAIPFGPCIALAAYLIYLYTIYRPFPLPF